MGIAEGLAVGVVDDHPMMREAVRAAIAGGNPNIRADGFERLEPFLAALEAGRRYDLVVLDLNLPGYQDMAALGALRQAHGELPVVVLSAADDRSSVLRALDLGAMGYIPKTSSQEVFLGALGHIMTGGIYVPPVALPVRRPPPNPLDELTERQRDVLARLIKGWPNKAICRELGLSENTVKSHLAVIFQVLHVSNRTQAVIASQEFGFRVGY